MMTGTRSPSCGLRVHFRTSMCVDGVGAMPHRLDGVEAAVRESTRLASEHRDDVRATQEEEPEADPKADKGKAKDDKGKKGKKDEPEEEELPLLQEKRDLTTKMFDTTEHYSNEWEDFNEEDNFAQKHDVELVKQMVRAAHPAPYPHPSHPNPHRSASPVTRTLALTPTLRPNPNR